MGGHFPDGPVTEDYTEGEDGVVDEVVDHALGDEVGCHYMESLSLV